MARQRQKQSESSLLPIFLTGVITLAATFVTSYFALKSDLKQSDIDLVKTFSTQLTEVQEKLFAAQMKIVRLELELGSKYGSNESLKQLLDSMSYPAWVKVTEPDPTNPKRPKIKMWYINTAYENFFKVKRDYYIGKTDFDVWPLSVAVSFYENDLHVLERSSSRCVTEAFPSRIFDKGDTMKRFVCKGAFKLNGMRSVAGQVLIPEVAPNQK